MPNPISRLKKAREDHAKLKELKKQENEKKELLRNAQNIIREMEQKIREACKKAGCSLYEELEEKEGLSDRKRTLRQNIEQREKDLQRIAHNGGQTEEEFVREAERYNPDDLPLQIKELNHQITEKEEDLSKIDQIIGSETKELEKMDGGSSATEASEEMKGILAQIFAAKRACVLRASATLSQSALERVFTLISIL